MLGKKCIKREKSWKASGDKLYLPAACFMYQLSVQILSGLGSVNVSESLTLFMPCWYTLWNTDVEGEFFESHEVNSVQTEERRSQMFVSGWGLLWNRGGNPQNTQMKNGCQQKWKSVTVCVNQRQEDTWSFSCYSSIHEWTAIVKRQTIRAGLLLFMLIKLIKFRFFVCIYNRVFQDKYSVIQWNCIN